MKLFEKYTYAQKNLALLIVGVLLFAVSYKRSFSKTLELFNYSDELDMKIREGEASQARIRLVQKELFDLNHLLGKEHITVELVQQKFLGFFDKYSKGLSVKQIDEVYSFDHPDFKINTLKIELEGNYNSVLRFIHKAEKDFSEARIIYVSNHLEKNILTQKNFLITTLLLQHYEQKD